MTARARPRRHIPARVASHQCGWRWRADSLGEAIVAWAWPRHRAIAWALVISALAAAVVLVRACS